MAIWRARRFPASTFDRSFSVADQNISTTPSSPDYPASLILGRRPKGRKSRRVDHKPGAPHEPKFWAEAHAVGAARPSVGVDQFTVQMQRA